MKGWKQDIFGIWSPENPEPQRQRVYERMEDAYLGLDPERVDKIEVVSRRGFEILRDGTVNVWKDGEKRQADWKEAARIRHLAYEIYGPDISRAAGLEPE